MSEIDAVVGWNVAFNRNPVKQFEHIERLEEKLRNLGATSVIFALNEMTNTLSDEHDSPALQKLLAANGYAVASRATTVFRRSHRYEGIGFASRDHELAGPIAQTAFNLTHNGKAHRHKHHNSVLGPLHRDHTRQVASLFTPDKAIHTTHASYYSPSPLESHNILRHAGQGGDQRLLIGDLNTGFNHRLVHMAQDSGWIKLRANNGKATFPLKFGPLPVWHLELDHALATPELAAQSTLEIGERGPSDHHPLIVITER